MNILEQAFRQPITTVLNQELNRLRRSGMTGTALLRRLGGLYHLHNMHEWQHRRATVDDEMPKIVCSEALV